MTTAVGFVGGRLVEARKARGITSVGLADIVGVSVQSLSKYENGHQIPRHDIIDKIVSILQFPKAYFFKQYAAYDETPIFWRSKLSAQAIDLDRSSVRLGWLKEIFDYLENFLDFPELSLPNFDIPKQVNEISFSLIEDIATTLRNYWNIPRGPIPDVLEKIELSGILVSRIHVKAEKVDAFSQWSDKFRIPFIILSRDKSSAVRQRFDTLHELGHMILHKYVSSDDLKSKTTYKLLEKQADKFASYMLLPEKDFLDELYAPTLDSLVYMKERWGVSIGSMIMRLSDLGILDDLATRRMWMNYARRGWRKGEPFDGVTEKESPQLIRRSFEMLLNTKTQTVADIKSALPFPAEDIEELADLPHGTLGAVSKDRVEPTLKKIGDNVISIFDHKR